MATEFTKFARIYETAEFGQLLVFIDQDDEQNAKLRFMFYMEQGVQVASAITFKDDDGFERCQAAFDTVYDQAHCEAMARDYCRMLEEGDDNH